MPMSGKEMLKLYLKHGWVAIRQRGSHVRVKNASGESETIPMHKELANGLEQVLLKKLKAKK
jgi:predicted RNA binding protein YcfA (HicA-like mRNA interferase family)